MEPKSSLPHSQQNASHPYFEPCAHPTSRWTILILPSHLRLGFPRGLFPPGVPTKTLYSFLLSPICATCTARLIFLDLFTQVIFGEEYTSWSSSLCSLFYSSDISPFLDPNIFLRTILSNTLSPRFSVGVIDQVSHLHKRTGKIIVLCIFIKL